MNDSHRSTDTQAARINRRLAGYMAGVGALGVASTANADIVANQNVQAWGINSEVQIDFNQDGQIDFEIDHDQVDLGNNNVIEYLQIDKNDTNGASVGESLLPIDSLDTFDLNGTEANDTSVSAYVTPTATASDYPAALPFGTLIDGSSSFEFQEGDNFNNTGDTIRANRLIDEDAGQVDTVFGGLTADQIVSPTNGPNFVGLGGEVRYLGLKMDLNSTGETNFGWIGIRITDEELALGEVVGYAYETTPGVGIAAGQIPEPSSVITAAIGGVAAVGGFLWRRWSQK